MAPVAKCFDSVAQVWAMSLHGPEGMWPRRCVAEGIAQRVARESRLSMVVRMPRTSSAKCGSHCRED